MNQTINCMYTCVNNKERCYLNGGGWVGGWVEEEVLPPSKANNREKRQTHTTECACMARQRGWVGGWVGGKEILHGCMVCMGGWVHEIE